MKTRRYLSDDIGWFQLANGADVLGYGTVEISLTAVTHAWLCIINYTYRNAILDIVNLTLKGGG